jgi:hypothetical protein
MNISTQDFTASQSVSDFELGLSANKFFFVITSDSAVYVETRIGIAGQQEKVDAILKKSGYYILDSSNGYKLWSRI